MVIWLSAPKNEQKSPIDDVIERIIKETAEIRKKFDELIKAIEEDRKKLVEASSGKK